MGGSLEDKGPGPRQGTSKFSLRVKTSHSCLSPLLPPGMLSLGWMSLFRWWGQRWPWTLTGFVFSIACGAHLQKKFPQIIGKFYLASNTRLVLCLNIYVGLFLTWARHKPTGISPCSRLETVWQFLCFFTESRHSPVTQMLAGFCADVERKAQGESSGSLPKDTWPEPMEQGQISVYLATKVRPFWYGCSEAAERRAHFDHRRHLLVLLSSALSTLDLACLFPSCWRSWCWMIQLSWVPLALGRQRSSHGRAWVP